MINMLNRRFGSEEAMGIRFRRDDGFIVMPSVMDDPQFAALREGRTYESFFLQSGLDAVCCTHYATEVFLEYPDRTIIVGYSNENNPQSRTATKGLHPGGHDFAIIDSRYLVDPWIKFVAMEGDQIVLNLEKDKDRIEAEVWYGKMEYWELMEEAIAFAKQLLNK